MKSPKTIAALTFTGLLGLTAAGYAARGMFRPGPILPEMTEPGPGPRGPDNRMLGVELGETEYDALTAWVEARNLSCKDTSARALMKRMRAKKKAEREAKIAAGEAVDAVSSASKKGGASPMMRNPQIRLSCENAHAAAFDGRQTDAKGRALFVFDSEDHPVRHASFRRLHASVRVGEADARATLARFEARFGPAHTVSRPVPAVGAGFDKWAPYESTWRWADLEAKVTVVDYGKRGFSVFEVLQVPLPIRPDAAAR